jgi:multidrug resistance efflux pump
VARAQVALSEAELEGARVGRERLSIRAPRDGRILQVNVRPGQFAATAWKEPLIVLGDVEHLHLRVDIDEHDLHAFVEGAEAVATLRGRPRDRFPLRFVAVQPCVIPKRGLTGATAERVDTRVLQVIYLLPDDRPVCVYPGQQLDVYIRAGESPRPVPAERAGRSVVKEAE